MIIDKDTINLLEYFYSIDGETKRSGELVWFIRVSGCNLQCGWCDTVYCHTDAGIPTNIKLLVKTIMDTNNCKRVTVTGGEPLIHKNIDKLVKQLLINGFDVNIETNGTVNPYKVFDKEVLQYREVGKLWFSMDYKSKSSSGQHLMLSAKEMASILRKEDCLKFVVASSEELEDAQKRIQLVERYYGNLGIKKENRCTYYISPCFGTIELPKIIDYMKTYNMIERIKFQIQVHKIVWDPNKRGV